MEVSLAKLTMSHKEQAARLEVTVTNAKNQMNDIIYKNGCASKNQRKAVTDTVDQLNERLGNHELILASMEAGLKQMEALEGRLVETIRSDMEDFEVRLGILEDSSAMLRAHWTSMEQMHTLTRGKELALPKVVQQVQASHGARLNNVEAKESIIEFLVGEVAKLNDKECLQTTTVTNTITPAMSPLEQWLNRVQHSYGSSKFAELHVGLAHYLWTDLRLTWYTMMVQAVTTLRIAPMKTHHPTTMKSKSLRLLAGPYQQWLSS